MVSRYRKQRRQQRLKSWLRVTTVGVVLGLGGAAYQYGWWDLLGQEVAGVFSQPLAQVPLPEAPVLQPEPTLPDEWQGSKPDELAPSGDVSLAEEPKSDETYQDDVRVKKNSTVYQTLKQVGLYGSEIHRLTQVAQPLFNLSNVNSGTRISVTRVTADESVAEIVFHLSKTRNLVLTRQGDKDWVAEMLEKAVTTKELVYVGEVRSNLWASAVEAGLDGQAIYSIADIFGWQIDFEREVMPGDSWRLLIERLYVEDQPYGWGNIIIAEYQRGSEQYSAIRYPSEGEEGEYFNWQGESLRGKFLKSPLRFSRISSRFQSKRFHPILGFHRPHNGVDYAAPTGTPVRAVGDGRAVLVGRRGGSGKMIKIKHNSTYQTAYKHLNGYAKGLKEGVKVSQGQVIGYVGATGLATGPHLHFEFYENGRYVDPLGKKFPREEVVPPENREDFARVGEIAKQKMAKSLKEVYQVADKDIAVPVDKIKRSGGL